MKTKFVLTFCLLSFAFSLSMGQVPLGLNYQAIARDGDGTELANVILPVRIAILSATGPDIVVWEEEHNATTNDFGLINLIVGNPLATRIDGSALLFTDIDWLVQPLFVKTRIFYENEWKDLGSAKLWSVPYAMVSDRAHSLTGNPLMMNGDTVYFLNNVAVGTDSPGKAKLAVVGDDPLSEDALFEVKRQDGYTVFAVYNQGVRINMPYDPEAKAPKGGFAIGGFDQTKGITQDYLFIDYDSARLYINDLPTVKGPKGGFAIGGFEKNKGVPQDYFVVSDDSVRLYISDSPVKGPKGGFAIGGFDKTKGTGDNYLEVTTKNTKVLVEDDGDFSVENVNTSESFINLTPENYFIGHQAGINTIPAAVSDDGKYNSFIGYQSGTSNVTGKGNIFLGYQSGINNTEGQNNVFIGNQTGYTNTGVGSFIGDYNVFIGYLTGYYNTEGQSNVFVGKQAGFRNTTGRYNTFLGQNTGAQNLDGNFNTFLGAKAAEFKTNGNNNTMVGNSAGANNYKGSGNVFVGYRSGMDEDGSNKFYIANGVGSNPMMYGDFTVSGHKLVINGDSVSNLGDDNFFVVGSAGGTIAWDAASDRRLKGNIITIGNALEKVNKLRGVNFEWNDERFPEGTQMGFIGQEAFEVIPEVVNNRGKYITMEYAPITALLVEAIKEQNLIIESQERIIDSLIDRLNKIEAALDIK
ncbi:MAG TPA: tail fiber domain-containing protein [Bacteroidales bacterium]|nr:tail fiber domain-containing protein [Bacteroidales bacterium]